MAERKLVSRQRIEDEIAARVKKWIEHSGDKIKPHLPKITPLREADPFGCNWTVMFVDSSGQPYITEAIQEVMGIYNLRSED